MNTGSILPAEASLSTIVIKLRQDAPNIRNMSRWSLHVSESQSNWYARIALFVIFFWFGALKVAFVSPASALVAELLEQTLPIISFEPFFIFLGVVEMLIGVLFLFPKLTKFALPVLLIHIFTTFGPLLLMQDAAWQMPLVPTLEGQYIIKNLALVALAIGVYVDAVHVKKKNG